jgi:tRNA threonylcarbamoyl adenosine modification protein (Sua5/YciO/YrdC/YwlC family)
MPPVLIDLTRVDDQRAAVDRAVQALTEGKLVAFPTETVYGIAANASDQRAVLRLLEVKGRRPGNPLAVAIRHGDEAAAYCPDLSAVGHRLARRCWPGPLTLVLDSQHPDSALGQLSQEVRHAVAPNGTVGLRVPDHPVLLAALRRLAGPLVLTSANRSGQAEAVTGEEVLAALGNDVDLVLSDGRSRYAQPSTVVRVGGNRLDILRQGVLTESALRRYASLIVLMVCTGNTCRSPMAQVLLQQRVAQRLKCRPDQLEDRGVMIMSAGVSAMSGARAAEEAVQAMQERGLDLSHHETRPLHDVLVRFADLILALTRGHREAIVEQWPDAASRTELLCRDHSDILDPIGNSLEVYRRCADQMDVHLAEWAARLDCDSIPLV